VSKGRNKQLPFDSTQPWRTRARFRVPGTNRGRVEITSSPPRARRGQRWGVERWDVIVGDPPLRKRKIPHPDPLPFLQRERQNTHTPRQMPAKDWCKRFPSAEQF